MGKDKRKFIPISIGLSWKKLQNIFKKTQKKMDKDIEHNKEMMLSKES